MLNSLTPTPWYMRHKLGQQPTSRNINTERLCFGKWATDSTFFNTNKTLLVEKRKLRPVPKVFTWTSGKHGRIFPLCFEQFGRCKSQWGWSFFTLFLRRRAEEFLPAPHDLHELCVVGSRLRENSRLQFEKIKNESKSRKEGGKATWSSVGAAFVKRLHPWITGAGCQFLLPPPHDLLELRAWTLLETQRDKKDRRKEVEEKEVKSRGVKDKGRKQSREADTKQLVNRWSANTRMEIFISCCLFSDWASLPMIYWASVSASSLRRFYQQIRRENLLVNQSLTGWLRLYGLHVNSASGLNKPREAFWWRRCEL